MFNGELALIEAINRLSPTEGSLSCYDKDWNMVKNTAVNKFAQAAPQRAPKCFDEMLDQAKRLSKAYEIFVRIDFYATIKDVFLVSLRLLLVQLSISLLKLKKCL